MSLRPEQSIEIGDDVVGDAPLVAEKLGLSTETFWRELKRGAIYGVAERGAGEDAGRLRLTFRYGLRSWTAILDGMIH